MAIVIDDQGFKCPIGEACWIGLGFHGDIAYVTAGLVEDTDHRSTAVVAALENRRSQGHELPEQLEGFFRVDLGDRLDDRTPLRIKIVGQGSHALPVDKRARPREGREPLAHLPRNFARALRPRQLQPQASFGGSVAGIEFDQQLGQPLGAEDFEILRAQSCFRGHSFSHAMNESNSLLSNLSRTSPYADCPDGVDGQHSCIRERPVRVGCDGISVSELTAFRV